MKKELRKQLLEERNNIPEEQRKQQSEEIENKLFQSEYYKKAKTIMFYVSVRSEVSTHSMIKQALQTKRVCFPVVKENCILAAEIKSIEDLNSKNEFGVLEPSNIIEIPKEEIDVIIVPGIAFDKDNYRIGYGLGYYDQFLKDTKTTTIGLAFKEQLINAIDKEEWDVALDGIISSK